MISPGLEPHSKAVRFGGNITSMGLMTVISDGQIIIIQFVPCAVFECLIRDGDFSGIWYLEIKIQSILICGNISRRPLPVECYALVLDLGVRSSRDPQCEDNQRQDENRFC